MYLAVWTMDKQTLISLVPIAVDFARALKLADFLCVMESVLNYLSEVVIRQLSVAMNISELVTACVCFYKAKRGSRSFSVELLQLLDHVQDILRVASFHLSSEH